MKLRTRLLLLVLGTAVIVALLVFYLNRMGAARAPYSSRRHPSTAEEHYVDWALEQLHLEKANPTAAAAAASNHAAESDRLRMGANDDDLLPVINKVLSPVYQSEQHCLNTEKIKELLSGEIPYEEVPLPDSRHRVTDQDMNDTRLHVIVIPFSHSDPGWIYTIDEYFAEHTRRTLDLMVEKLEQYSDLKFVWSEAVFLHMWWQNLSDSVKSTVRRLISTGKLQIAHGSWVMADEAVNSLYALVTNMAVGHEWVRRELQPDFVPRHSWSVDVFGYSRTSARLQHDAGLEALVLLRVHAQVKSFLSRHRDLEFYWSWPHRFGANVTMQPGGSAFDDHRPAAIFCHIEPGRLYSISQSCGPDPRVCFQFDFRHIDGIDPVDTSFDLTITDANIAMKATMLAEQYHLKSRQFGGKDMTRRPAVGSNVGGGDSSSSSRAASAIMVPLGDDFRFDQAQEWDQQYANYRRLFDYYSAHPELGIEARFGTPADYYAIVGRGAGLVGSESDSLPPPKPSNQPSIALPPAPPCLVGDFFPYVDEPAYGDYWTGFYSTRMWLKVLGRQLERRLRTAQILHVGSLLKQLPPPAADSRAETEKEAALLQDAERSLALYAHHDAVTGTSKPHVAVDYNSKLTAAIASADAVAAQSVRRLTQSEGVPRLQTITVEDVSDEPLIAFDSILSSTNATGKLHADGVGQMLADLDEGVGVTLFNPILNDVETVVRLTVDRPDVAVYHSTRFADAPSSGAVDGSFVTACQVNPLFSDADLCEPSGYQLALQVKLQALGSLGLTLRPSEASVVRSTVLREESLVNERRDTAGDRTGPLVCVPAKVTSFARDAAQASRQKTCLTESAITAKATSADVKAAEWRRSALVRLVSRATDGRFLATAAAGKAFFSASSGLPLAFYPGCPGGAAASSGGSPSPEPITLNLHAATYQTSLSGAYIFRLREVESFPAPIEQLPLVISAVVKAVGPVETVVSSVRCWNSSGGTASAATSCLSVSTRLTDADSGLRVALRSFLRSAQQLIVRLNTSVRNDDRTFQTDSNGLDMMARTTRPSLPPGGNYYPITAAAFIEDADPNVDGGDGGVGGGGRRRRVTLLTGQPGGVSSLARGQLEVMVDRMLAADDGRGLGEGVKDNRVTASVFCVLPEVLPVKKAKADGEATYLSPAATLSLLKLQNPIAAFSWAPTSGSSSNVAAASAAAAPLTFPALTFPALFDPSAVQCGGVVHLLMARVLPTEPRGGGGDKGRWLSLAVILHVMHADGSLFADREPSHVGCMHPSVVAPQLTAAGGPARASCPQKSGNSEATFDMASLLSSDHKPTSISWTSLTMMQTRMTLASDAVLSLPAGGVYAFNVTFSFAGGGV